MNNNYVTISSDKSKTVALILCILGGYIGLHYFYVGRIGKGLLYMFTFGFCGIGWILDLIAILTGGFKDNAGAALRR